MNGTHLTEGLEESGSRGFHITGSQMTYIWMLEISVLKKYSVIPPTAFFLSFNVLPISLSLYLISLFQIPTPPRFPCISEAASLAICHFQIDMLSEPYLPPSGDCQSIFQSKNCFFPKRTLRPDVKAIVALFNSAI